MDDERKAILKIRRAANGDPQWYSDKVQTDLEAEMVYLHLEAEMVYLHWSETMKKLDKVYPGFFGIDPGKRQ